jgi:hypothetical protein
MRPGAWTQALDRLDTAVNEILALDIQMAEPGELGECLVRFQATKNRLCAAETTMLAGFDRSQDWRADGSKSSAAWLAARCRTPRKVLAGLVRLGKRLRRMPRTRAALALGVIDQSRAEALARLADSPRQPVRDAFVEQEADLVGHACDLGEEELARALVYWRDAADPDGGEDQARKDHENRRVHLSQSIGGTWFLDGQLDPVGGAELAEALRRIEEDLFKADWAAARELHGDDTRIEHLARTGPQRRADALVDMARRAMAAPAGARLPAPLVSILCGYETFKGPVREMFNGTVLSPGQIAGLLTEADIERVVYTNAGRDISDLGRRARFFNAAQRRVIELRDRVCFHPTCDTSAEHSQMDHIEPFVPHGETNIDNGRPACRKHNNDRNQHDPPDPDP